MFPLLQCISFLFFSNHYFHLPVQLPVTPKYHLENILFLYCEPEHLMLLVTHHKWHSASAYKKRCRQGPL